MRDLLKNDWFVNIVGGIAVALLIALLTTFVVPRWRRFKMRGGHDISGVWDVFDAPNPQGAPVGNWTIRQKGKRLRIKIVRRLNRKGEDMWREFEAWGSWEADQLSCTFRDINGRHRTGAIVLRWMGSGQATVLSGRTVYWDRTPAVGEHLDAAPSGVVALPYCLQRRRAVDAV